MGPQAGVSLCFLFSLVIMKKLVMTEPNPNPNLTYETPWSKSLTLPSRMFLLQGLCTCCFHYLKRLIPQIFMWGVSLFRFLFIF